MAGGEYKFKLVEEMAKLNCILMGHQWLITKTVQYIIYGQQNRRLNVLYRYNKTSNGLFANVTYDTTHTNFTTHECGY